MRGHLKLLPRTVPLIDFSLPSLIAIYNAERDGESMICLKYS